MKLKLRKSLYSREGLEAAALALGKRARVLLDSAGKDWRVEITGDWRGFLDEALAHSLRAMTLEVNRPLAAASLSSAVERGLTPQPPDPLEELEPQVRADRAAETAALLAEARKL